MSLVSTETGGYSLSTNGSGLVTLTFSSTDSPLAKSGSGTLTYRYATTPWTIGKYTLAPLDSSRKTALPKSPLENFDYYVLTPSVSFSLSKSALPASNDLSSDTVTLHDKTVNYSLVSHLTEGGAFLVPVNRSDLQPVLAGEFQFVQLPAAKDWPITSGTSATSTDTWVLFNTSGSDLLGGTVEIYKDAAGTGSPSGTASLSATPKIDLMDAIKKFCDAMNSGGNVPSSVATLLVGPAGSANVTVKYNGDPGMVFGTTSTLTLSGSSSVKSDFAFPGAASKWSGDGKGPISMSLAGTPITVTSGDFDPTGQSLSLASNSHGTLTVATTNACEQSVSGSVGAGSSQSPVSRQGLLFGSGTLQLDSGSLGISNLTASASQNVLFIDPFQALVHLPASSCYSMPSASVSGDLLWTDSAGSVSYSSPFQVTMDATAALCGSFQLAKATTGEFNGAAKPAQGDKATAPIPWRIDANGTVQLPSCRETPASYALNILATAGSVARPAPITFTSLSATLPLDWSGTTSLTLTGTGGHVTIKGRATATISLGTTRSTTITAKSSKATTIPWLLLFAEKGHNFVNHAGAQPSLLTASSDGTLSFTDTVNPTVIDFAYAKQLISLNNEVVRAQDRVSDANEELSIEQTRLDQLNAEPDSDQKASAVVIQSTKVEQATERLNRATNASDQAKFIFQRTLYAAEDSARRHQ